MRRRFQECDGLCQVAVTGFLVSASAKSKVECGPPTFSLFRQRKGGAKRKRPSLCRLPCRQRSGPVPPHPAAVARISHARRTSVSRHVGAAFVSDGRVAWVPRKSRRRHEIGNGVHSGDVHMHVRKLPSKGYAQQYLFVDRLEHVLIHNTSMAGGPYFLSYKIEIAHCRSASILARA